MFSSTHLVSRAFAGEDINIRTPQQHPASEQLDPTQHKPSEFEQPKWRTVYKKIISGVSTQVKHFGPPS
jgi:hypothetical protein